jgi:hypothetical protein
MVNAKQDLYATADGRLVGEDNPEQAYLVARKGTAIEPKLAKRLGLNEKSLTAFYETQGGTPENEPETRAETNPPPTPVPAPEPAKEPEKTTPRSEGPAPVPREETKRDLDLKGGREPEKRK